MRNFALVLVGALVQMGGGVLAGILGFGLEVQSWRGIMLGFALLTFGRMAVVAATDQVSRG